MENNEIDKIIKDFIRNITLQKTQYIQLITQLELYRASDNYKPHHADCISVTNSLESQIRELLINETDRIVDDFVNIVESFTWSVDDAMSCGKMIKYLYDFLKNDDGIFNTTLKSKITSFNYNIKDLYGFGCYRSELFVEKYQQIYRDFYRFMYNENIDKK